MTHIVIPTSDPIASLKFSEVYEIDISEFTDNDYISLSLPDFPSTKLDFAQSFVDFTSNPTGDFGVGPTDFISFDQADPSLPGTNGDTEMRIPISLLSTIDKTSLTGVRFRLYATKDCTFRCLSIRACSEKWKYAPVDINTLWNRVERPPSTDGTADQAFDFPPTKESGWPSAFPVVFRADNFSGLKDPKPINVSIGATFSTGSLDAATGDDDDTFNVLAFYFRDIPTDDQVQLELNTLTQADLNSISAQPDFGTATYTDRSQEVLDLQDQTDLDKGTQLDMERLPDYSTHTNLEVKLKWCDTPSLNTLTIFNADGDGYTFSDFTLDAASSTDLDAGQYILLMDLKDDSMRVRIYGIDQVGNIDRSNLVLDSGQIIDDVLIKRRKGRFGWWGQFVDGDAYLYNIKTRGVNYGEIRTKKFGSITPVKGVSVYAGNTSSKELFTEIAPTPWTSPPVAVVLDPTASATGNAYKITSTPGASLQGIMTNPFLLDSFTDLRISFNVKFPALASQTPGSNLTAFLIGQYSQTIPMNVSAFKDDTWAKVRVDLKDTLIQTGSYHLVLVQTRPVAATTWWLENLSIQTAAIRWSARSHGSDAWGLDNDQWIPAGVTLNSLNGGMVFPEKGNDLQVRGEALRQDAAIYEFKTIPQYATLGRLVWEDESSDQGYSPSADISVDQDDLTISVSAIASDPDGSIVSYLWSFGDDTYDSGMATSHTYDRSGTYIVTLIVTDDFGNTGSSQETVTVP